MLSQAQKDRNEARIATLEPAAQPSAREILVELAARGWDAFVIFGRRSRAEQATLYANRKPGQRVSPPGKSMHEFGLALDLGILVNGKYITDGAHPGYKMIGEVAKAHGWDWGGDWGGDKDPDHIEYHPGETPRAAILRLRKVAGLA